MRTVREVLRCPGQALDAASRSLFEPRFKHDFSKVRVHTDTNAAASARVLNALAYTVGDDVIFASGQYAPRSSEGVALLAHELTHVVQQRGLAATRGEVAKGDSDPVAEREADATAADVARSHNGPMLTIRHAPSEPVVARQTTAEEFPGFSQGDYVTCGAASLVSALLIWDRERKDPKSPNTLLIAACDSVLVYLDDHQTTLIEGWDNIKLNGQTGLGQKIYDDTFNTVMVVRDAAMAPQAQIDQRQYEKLGLALYVLFKNDDGTGLGQFLRKQLVEIIGIAPTKTASGSSFDALMDELSGLEPGQVAQVSWYSRGKTQADGSFVYGPHAFLVGRFQRGTWFVSDQGERPPLEIEAPDLTTLTAAIRNNTSTRDQGILTGPRPVEKSVVGQPILSRVSDAGIMILGDRSGIELKARDIIMTPGDFIAEIDASVVHFGDRLVAGGFVARTKDLAAARSEIGQAGAGFVIVEDPVGLFHVFKTSLVGEANVMETKIDERNSAGGKLAQPRRFYSAWLQLRSASRSGTLFQVY